MYFLPFYQKYPQSATLSRKKVQLLADEGIIRNWLKIRASVKNSCIFWSVQREYAVNDAAAEVLTPRRLFYLRKCPVDILTLLGYNEANNIRIRGRWNVS